MDKIPIIIVTVVILAAVFFLWYSGATKTGIEPTPMPAGIVFFYGDTCPHCKNVEDFISQNKIADKVKFTQLEVSQNQSNALLLANTEQSCKIDISSGASVPLLWDGSKCYLGDEDAINFFKNAAGIK